MGLQDPFIPGLVLSEDTYEPLGKSFQSSEQWGDVSPWGRCEANMAAHAWHIVRMLVLAHPSGLRLVPPSGLPCLCLAESLPGPLRLR